MQMSQIAFLSTAGITLGDGVSTTSSVSSTFCLCCDCETCLAHTGKAMPLCVNKTFLSQNARERLVNLHFICLMMYPNRHFIVHHTAVTLRLCLVSIKLPWCAQSRSFPLPIGIKHKQRSTCWLNNNQTADEMQRAWPFSNMMMVYMCSKWLVMVTQ